MLNHALKRLLVLLPAVWLVASAVFLLSKTVPGQASETEFEQAAQSANSKAKSAAYQRAYRQMLHRTGQDLPLFYFGLGTAAEPDTLHRIFPETDRNFLKSLIRQFGNWPQAAAFYKSLQRLSQSADNTQPAVKTQLGQIMQHPEKERLESNMARLQKLCAASGNVRLQEAGSDVQQQYLSLKANAAPEGNLLPRFFWHGKANQYHSWFGALLQGNLGFSNRDSRPVTEIIAEAFGVTCWLALAAFLLTAILAPEIAMVLSRKSNKNWRHWVLRALYMLESVPLFILALLVLALSSYAGWLYDFPEEVSKALVVLCLVLVNLPYLTGQAFAAVQTALQENYVLTARAKGLPDKLVLRKHVLRNSLLPVITLLSDFLPALLAGTVMLEVIFSVPGMGRLLVMAVLTRDYAVITGIVLLVGAIKMLAHLLADLLYAFADPRINHRV